MLAVKAALTCMKSCFYGKIQGKTRFPAIFLENFKKCTCLATRTVTEVSREFCGSSYIP